MCFVLNHLYFCRPDIKTNHRLKLNQNGFCWCLWFCRGIVASILVFLCFGVTQAKDGPFTRPHPGKIITSTQAKEN